MFQKHKEAKAKAQKDEELRAFVLPLIDADGVMSEENETTLMRYLAEHGYADEEGNLLGDEIPRDVASAFMLGMANNGRFVGCESSLLLKHGEVALCERAARLLKEVTDREFRGGSRGVSVPLGHGVRYRAGAVRGHMVTVGTHWQTADVGVITVTSQRAVYHGERKTLEFPFAKLATVNTYTDAVDLGVTSRQSTSTFAVDEPEFIAGMVRAAFNANSA